jgi:hypothetical protein
MAVQIRKARRSATKLRLLLTSPSGGGKTYGALLLAKGLGGRTVVIDTEEGSSDLYDTLHDFDVIDLKPPFTPEAYIESITGAEEAGYEIIVVDSVTQCWSGPGGCLELLDHIAKSQFRGNTWSAFSVITPRWRAFVDKLLRSPAHIICTGRSKTETAQVDDHGKKKVAKLGMKLEARDGLEYEFTCVLDLIHDGHYATVSKDRTGLFSGDPKPITADTGRRLAEWLASAGAPSPVPAAPQGARAAPAAQATAASAFDLAKKSIAESCSLDGLDVLRQRVDLRLGQGVFSPDEHMELVAAIHARAEELTDPDAGLGFPSESPETEAHA